VLARFAYLAVAHAFAALWEARTDEVALIESSLVLCGESGVLDELVDGALVGVCC
jgi:hypothetical protein